MALSEIIKENEYEYTGTDPVQDAEVVWWNRHRALYHVDDTDVTKLKTKEHTHDEDDVDPFVVFGHGI